MTPGPALEPMHAGSAAETLAFLSRAPYENVYLAWLIESGQVARGSGSVLLVRDPTGAPAGVCHVGGHIVPSLGASAPPGTLAAFAREVRGGERPRTILGERSAVLELWEHARPLLGPAAYERERQPLYAVTRTTLRGSRRDAIVDRATRSEVDEIVPHSASMIAGEIGTDPRRAKGGFADRTRRIIDAGWWWRSRVLGRLAFMCNIGSATAYTAQLQGVWMPPELRGRGYATRALGAICDHLLDEYPSLCLYVNDFNAAAIALYERVGFTPVGAFATIGF